MAVSKYVGVGFQSSQISRSIYTKGENGALLRNVSMILERLNAACRTSFAACVYAADPTLPSQHLRF